MIGIAMFWNFQKWGGGGGYPKWGGGGGVFEMGGLNPSTNYELN